jgi:drug/metabolite transporter (DMT)-like permease
LETKSKTENSSLKLAWFLLILLSFVWGASYILIKTALKDTEGNVRLLPDQLGASRMFVASLVLLPFFFKFLHTIRRKHVLLLIVAGICGNGLPAFLFSYAQIHLDSAITGMLNSTTPIFAITISAVIFAFKIKWNHIVGITIGVFGAFLIMYSKLKDVTLSQEEVLPFVLVVLATLCYAISLNVIKYKLSDLKPMAITSTSFLFAGVPSAIYLIVIGFPNELMTNDYALEGFGVVSILAIVGTALAVYLFNHLIQISSPIFASSVTYFMPAIATFLGFLAGEDLSYYQLTGMLVLVSGVVLINKKAKISKPQQSL